MLASEAGAGVGSGFSDKEYKAAGATLPYGLAIANKGFKQAVKDDAALALGVNVCRGKLTIPSVADAHEMPYTPMEAAIAS